MLRLADALRAAGRPLAPPPPPPMQKAHARTVRDRLDLPAAPAAAVPDPAAAADVDAPRWDRVDRMFLLDED